MIDAAVRDMLANLVDQARRNVDTLTLLIREGGGNPEPSLVLQRQIVELRQALADQAESLTRECWAREIDRRRQTDRRAGQDRRRADGGFPW